MQKLLEAIRAQWRILGVSLVALLAFILLLPALAQAQFTQVTGTVTDPNGLPYSNGTISTKIVPSSASPTLSGLPYTPPVGPAQLDGNGSFTIRLGDNTVLAPAGTQWQFTVCNVPVQPPVGTGPQCFTAAPITISGGSQSISTQLSAAASAQVKLLASPGVTGTPTFAISPWADVTSPSYGADKTGAADATGAIQAAVNAVAPGGTVYFPAGTYKTTAEITSIATAGKSQGVTFRGDGPQKSVIVPTGSNGCVFRVEGVTASFLGQYQRGTTFAELGISATAPGANLCGIKVTGVSEAKFLHVRINGLTSDGIQFPVRTDLSTNPDHYGSNFFEVAQSEISNNTGWGVFGGDGLDASGTIHDNFLFFNAEGGYFGSGQGFTMYGNTIYGNGSASPYTGCGYFSSRSANAAKQGAKIFSNGFDGNMACHIWDGGGFALTASENILQSHLNIAVVDGILRPNVHVRVSRGDTSLSTANWAYQRNFHASGSGIPNQSMTLYQLLDNDAGIGVVEDPVWPAAQNPTNYVKMSVGGGAIATASFAAGAVTTVAVNNSGLAYTSVPSILFVGGGGSGATATAVTSNVVHYVNVTSGGNCTVQPTIGLSGGGGTGATIVGVWSTFGTANVLQRIYSTAGGSGYTSAPSVTFSGGTCTTTPTATASIAAGVTSVTVNAGGSGYTSAPTVMFVPATYALFKSNNVDLIDRAAGSSTLGVASVSPTISTGVSQGSGQGSVNTSSPGPSDPICYVSFRGNDSNNGRSWGTAKQTIMACYDSLPQAGGTILIMDGGGNEPTSVKSQADGKGIWIVGPVDANYNSPPPGWRRVKSVTFKGVAGEANPVNGHEASVLVQGGSATDPNVPAVWLSGTNTTIKFENLHFINSLGLGRLARGLLLGINTNGARTNGFVSGVTFDNVAAYADDGPNYGPAVDIGAGVFWVYFRNYSFRANQKVPVTDDKHASVLIKPDPSGPSSGLIFEDGNLNGGGIKYYAGSTSASLYVTNLTLEGDLIDPLPPGVWFASINNFTTAHLRDISVSDAPPGPCPAVQVDESTPGSVSPEVVLVENASGQEISVKGPATVLQQYPANYQGLTVGPERERQAGFFGGHGQPISRVVGQTDSARRGFGPVAIRFPNLAKQLPSDWVVEPGSSGTITSKVVAPDGTMNAGRWSTTQPDRQAVDFYQGNIQASVGDFFIAGLWARSTSGNGFIGGEVAAFPIQGVSIDRVFGIAQFMKGDGEWQWNYQIVKITGTIGSLHLVAFHGWANSAHTAEFYAPILVQIPAGSGVSDNEAWDIALHLQSYTDAIGRPGTVAMLRGQQFAFSSTSSSFYGLLAHSNTANRTYNFPDASGTVPLLNLPQTWTASQILTTPELTRPQINGETISAAPRGIYNAFLPGALTTNYVAADYTPDRGIIVTRVEVSLKTPPMNCAGNAVVRIVASNYIDVILAAASNDSGPISLNMDSSVPVQVLLQTGATGCSVSPQDANVVVHYRMQ